MKKALITLLAIAMTTIAAMAQDEALEDLPGDETGDLGENILAFVHNQWVEATKLRTHFKSRLSKNCYKILRFNYLQALMRLLTHHE